MTKKKAFNRLKADVGVLRPKTAKLFLAAGIPFTEEPPVKAKKRRWLPAAALCCTAAVAIAVCVPVYLNMQGNHGIAGGVTSSALKEEKKKLVWSMGGRLETDAAIETGPIDEELQKAMDDPANEGKLFCVRAEAPLSADENFVFEGESMTSMQQKINEVLQKAEQLLEEPEKKYGWGNIPTEAWIQYQNEADKLSALLTQYEDQKNKIRIASLKAQIEELKKQLPPDIKISAAEESSDLLEIGGECYSEVTRDQIEQLVTLGFNYIRLTVPARVEGYDRRIADSLVAMLEYEPQKTYFVRVNSVLCKQTSYGNENYNADLIRELKDEESTQEFGDNFLAAIRQRHGIEEKYIYEERWQGGSCTYDNGETKKCYSDGFFEAKLTKEEILELAEDSDVRSIYPASSVYEYHIKEING